MKRLLFIIQLILSGSNLVIQAKTLDDSIPSGKNYDKAVFRLWYPDSFKFIKGLIILMPGSNGDGRNLAEEPFWQALALHNNFALMGCYFTDLPHENMVIENYVNVKDGSGQALLDVLAQFARKSEHPELSNTPVLLWGHSAGGEFNYEFVCWKPERVIAFIVNKGGIYYSALASDQTRNVPGIFFTGEKDLESRSNIVKGIFSLNRRVGALWAFAEEPGAAHEIGRTRELAALFFNEIIPLRLPNESRANDCYVKLKPLSENTGYMGDYKAQIFEPFVNQQKANYPTAWLPTYKFADAWLLFIKGKPF